LVLDEYNANSPLNKSMLQPVSALSVVAMAGIGSQRVLSYTVVTFLIAGAVNAAALLLLT